MHTSLSKRILYPSLATIALGVLISLAVTSFTTRETAEDELIKRLQRETHLTARLIDSWLKTRGTDITLWSRQEVFSRALTAGESTAFAAQAQAQRTLTALQEQYPFYEGVFLATPQGGMLAISTMDAHLLDHVKLNDRRYFQQALEGNLVFSPVLISRLSGNKIFTVTAPVTVNGSTVGILGGIVDFAAFTQLFLDDFKVKKHGFAFLVDTAGEVVACSAHSEEEMTSRHHGDALLRIAAEQRGAFIRRLDQGKTLTVFQRLETVPWAITINQSLDGTLAPLAHTAWLNTAIGLLMLALVFAVVGTLFRQRISKRLEAMLPVIAAVSAGDLRQRIDPASRPADEISVLAGAFNAMVERLETTMDQLKEEIQMRKDTERSLAYHQENLEQIIAERSLALENEIIEHKRAEDRLAQLERQEMIGALAGGVAHELNNILSGMVTYPDLLLRKVPAESPLAKPLAAIRQSGEKAAAIVQDLLTLARRGVVAKESVRLDTVVGEYLRGPEHALVRQRRPGIDISAEYATGLGSILGSPAHLGKTVMHLVANAAATMPNSGRIRLITEERRIERSLGRYEFIDTGDYAVLTVEDEGEGFRSEDLARIFEPFYTSKKLGLDGSGLGMAVVWGTVKDHGGFIDCDSRIGGGTRFTLYFPLNGPAQRLHPRPVAGNGSSGRGERILVIDDNQQQREIAAAILGELGYTVTVAASGEEGVALAGHRSFDLVLLDMLLGQGIDGLETYRRLLAANPTQQALIVSGFSDNDRVAEALRLGAGGHLKKPYTIDTLARAVRGLLDGHTLC